MTTKERALERVASLSRKIEKGEHDLNARKWQRADAMLEAKDAGATLRENASAAGLAQSSAQIHIRVAETYRLGGTRSEYQEAYNEIRGGSARERLVETNTKHVLSDAPLETIEQVVAGLPAERRQALAAATGHAYAQARQERDEHERNLTDHERREREEAQERVSRSARQAVAGFSSLGIVEHIEQATEEIRELTADASVTPEVARRIKRATDALVREVDFALEMVGEEV